MTDTDSVGQTLSSLELYLVIIIIITILTHFRIENSWFVLIYCLQHTACALRQKSLKQCGFSRKIQADYLMTLQCLKAS